MERLLGVSVIAASSVVGFTLTSAAASRGTFDSARAPGVDVMVDCATGQGYIQVGNADMAGSTIEVTIDGARQPDIDVDHAGELHQWYALAPGQPHRLIFVYDFVPGNPEEENQVMTVSCLDDAPTPETGAASHFTSLSPARVWDTRVGPGPTGRLGAGQTRAIPVTGTGGVPATGVTAVALNVTAVNPSAPTHVTAWPTGEGQPLASNLNVPAGDVRANVVLVKVGADGKVSFNNNAGTLDLIADIAGYFSN